MFDRIANRFSRFSVRTKINLTVSLIFLLVISIVTAFSYYREHERVLMLTEQQTRNITNAYFDSLNTMMLTGTMNERAILRKKVLNQEGVIEARVIRGQGVIEQYGKGTEDEQPQDEWDEKALAGESIVRVHKHESGRALTVLTPFRATENTRGVNCLACHNVPSGSVNGVVRVSYSLAKLDKGLILDQWWGIIANVVLLGIGLILANFLLRRWISVPLANLMMVVTKRSQGDISIRAEVTGHDELGCLGDAFNTMADNVNRIAEREHDAAEALRSKVDILLAVVNRAAEGDLTGKVTFSGDDTIGSLGVGLQTMIDNLDALIEGKRRDVALLQSRVDTILDVVTKAAEGDLTGHLSIEGDDAVAQLGAGVQRMVDNLNTLLAQVQQSGIQVTSSGTEIAATAKQQEATVTQQAATANQIVATATEISATTKELVCTMDEVAAVAERTTDSAESSHSGLAKMEDTMSHVVDASATIAAKLEVLNEKAVNINTVVTTITKVADQTNLLSLNAAIEAEKAGEYGLGFSVVATEIRRLADQTAVATWDIEQMVKEMQSAVSAGVMSVDKFSKEVQNSVEVVRQVGTDLKQIIEQVQALTPRFESVHEGMQFQAQGAEQIKQAIVQLSEAAQQTVESLGQSNSAIERLNDAAHGLQTGVSRFKVLGHTRHHE